MCTPVGHILEKAAEGEVTSLMDKPQEAVMGFGNGICSLGLSFHICQVGGWSLLCMRVSRGCHEDIVRGVRGWQDRRFAAQSNELCRRLIR